MAARDFTPILESDMHKFRQTMNPSAQAMREWIKLLESFGELSDLLEQHAPVWYTREHHERAKAVEQSLKKVWKQPTDDSRPHPRRNRNR